MISAGERVHFTALLIGWYFNFPSGFLLLRLCNNHNAFHIHPHKTAPWRSFNICRQLHWTYCWEVCNISSVECPVVPLPTVWNFKIITIRKTSSYSQEKGCRASPPQPEQCGICRKAMDKEHTPWGSPRRGPLRSTCKAAFRKRMLTLKFDLKG